MRNGPKRGRLTAPVPLDDLEALRDIAWWRRQTLTSLVTEAISEKIERHCDEEVTLTDPADGRTFTKAAGEPYPSRSANLSAGRPLK